jgi:hypothetical protein
MTGAIDGVSVSCSVDTLLTPLAPRLEVGYGGHRPPQKRHGEGPRRHAMTQSAFAPFTFRGRMGLNQATIQSQTTAGPTRFWLKRIGRWIAYAHSVVDE